MRVIVAHPAQQHSYELATALEKCGYLDIYSTTVYYKKNNFTYLVSVLLKGNFKKRAENRCCSSIPANKVVQFCEMKGLLKLLSLNNSLLKKYFKQIKYSTADSFAKKVAKYAIKHNVDAVVSYDDSSPLLFEILEQNAPNIIRIMDMSAANLLYMRTIYEQDEKLSPQFSERLRREREIVWDPFVIDRTKREIKSTQHFLVPSNFVKESLAYSAVKEKQMHLCPYGVDLTVFYQKQYKEYIDDEPLNFIYVGGVKELKGISYLLEAFRQIDPKVAKLTVVGNFDKNDKDIEPYLDIVHFAGLVLHDEIPDFLRKADVYVFPSLGEGLSLSTLEAAACGLPLIVSKNSGVNDGMTDGKEGFVIPIQSVDAIVDKVRWFINNKNQIQLMGNHARSFAIKYTWDHYYTRIQAIFKNEIHR